MDISSLIKSHKKKSITISVVGVLFLIVVIFMVTNKIAPVSWGWWGDTNSADGVAISGYDAVAYHTQGVAEKGSAEKSYRWKDVDWHFVSDKNKALFMANSEKFSPQYGGYCAYAVSKGVTADANPESWIIQKGKLYLLADNQVKTSWADEEEDGIINQADENWRKR